MQQDRIEQWHREDDHAEAFEEAADHGVEYDFFFQAEDCIRDFHVTGVQTCALPIFGLDDLFARTRLRVSEKTNGIAVPWYASKIGRASCREKCRSRWSPYH